MRKGFTILEVMVAAAILAVGTLGVLGMQLSVGEYNRSISMRMAAVTLAEQQLAILELQAVNGCEAGSLCWRLSNWQNEGDWHGYDFGGGESGAGVVMSRSGIFQSGGTGDGLDNRFYVSYYNLGSRSTDSDEFGLLCPMTQCVRGAIRVTWAKSSRGSQECMTRETFRKFERADTRIDESTRECDFVSFPFVFSTSNIYKT